MADDRLKPDGPIPFDGERMIYAGFEANFDIGNGGTFGYVDDMVTSVRDGNRQRLIHHAAQTAKLLQEKGVAPGRRRARRQGHRLQALRAGKTGRDGVVFGWIEW